MKIRIVPLLILMILYFSNVLFAERYDDANRYYQEAYNLYRFGKIGQSMELLKKVIEIDPDHAEAHFGLGSIYFRQNMYDDAAREFTMVTRIKPEYAQAYERLWLAYKKSGRNDEADEALQKYKKILLERMQALSVGPPQVVKPVSPNAQEEKVESKLPETTVETSRPSEMKSSGTTIPETKLAESGHSETEEEEEYDDVEEKENILSVVKPVIPKLKESAERSDKGPKTPILETGPPETKPADPSIQSTKIESTKLNTEHKSPLIRTKQHNLFKSFRNKNATFFNNPFKKAAEILNKSYAGKLLKWLIYYVMTVQIWLCVVASLFIYIRKKNHKKQIAQEEFQRNQKVGKNNL